jgi:hypothetical protein
VFDRLNAPLRFRALTSIRLACRRSLRFRVVGADGSWKDRSFGFPSAHKQIGKSSAVEARPVTLRNFRFVLVHWLTELSDLPMSVPNGGDLWETRGYGDLRSTWG